jgi:hypothetical protein
MPLEQQDNGERFFLPANSDISDLGSFKWQAGEVSSHFG